MKDLFNVSERVGRLYRLYSGVISNEVKEDCREAMERVATGRLKAETETDRENLRDIIEYYLKHITAEELAAIYQNYLEEVTEEEITSRNSNTVIKWLVEEATTKPKALNSIVLSAYRVI